MGNKIEQIATDVFCLIYNRQDKKWNVSLFLGINLIYNEAFVLKFISIHQSLLSQSLQGYVSRLEGKIMNYFSHFLTKTYVVGAQKNSLFKTVLLGTQNICLNEWVRN